LTQTSIGDLTGPDFPAGETALTGTALLVASDNLDFNDTLNAVGSVIGGGLEMSASATIDDGSLVSLGSNNTIFDASATITVNPGSGIVLPEPSAVSLAAISAMAFLRRRRSARC
jgi:hypothetical protein